MKTLLLKIVVSGSLAIAPLCVQAQMKSIAALNFKTWKQQQETDAQNRVVRLSNNLLLLKSERYNPKNILPEVASASKEEEPQPSPEESAQKVLENEKLLEEAIERLEFTKELTIKDYFSVYLSQFKDQPKVLKEVAKSMSQEEVAEILQVVLVENSEKPDSPKL